MLVVGVLTYDKNINSKNYKFSTVGVDTNSGMRRGIVLSEIRFIIIFKRGRLKQEGVQALVRTPTVG